MTTRQFNESVNADIRRMTNKAKGMDEYDPLLAAYNNGDGSQQGEPTSFSAWLEANNDSIEMPLDRTEATAQWFDEKAEHENDLRHESRKDYESDQLAGNPPEQGE